MTKEQVEKIKECFIKSSLTQFDYGNQHEGDFRIDAIREQDGKTTAWLHDGRTINLESEDFEDFSFYKQVTPE